MNRRRTAFEYCLVGLIAIVCVGCEHADQLADQIISQTERNAQAGAKTPLTGQFQPNVQPNAQPNLSSKLISQATSNRVPGLPVRNGQTILIASFNIQVFGTSKMSKPGIPEHLAEVIRQFDVVAIQEIRDRSGSSLPLLLEYINSNGSRYDYIISPPLGRTVSKEQYAFVFNTETIISATEFSYLVEDSNDLLHREPLVARFVCKIAPGYQPFRFTLVNFHSDPDEAAQEIKVLSSVLKSIRNFEFANGGEDDVIMMGDMNVEPRNFGTLAEVPGLSWLINEPTNTRKTKIWDNILIDRELTNEHTGRSGVLDLEQMFRITRDEALAISDHLPIWSEYYAVEMPYANAGRSATGNSLPVR
ncbi:MAG: endonuclease/exonuclease/phosphatase family protein [Pirellula sp.]|nr:endonuclease/exonuclease/phosphatase family protein [Pirellula sp.]